MLSMDSKWLLSVAPMMDWTDRHCRAFHRALTAEALLYTEMVTAPAVVNGDRERLLGFDALDGPWVEDDHHNFVRYKYRVPQVQ